MIRAHALAALAAVFLGPFALYRRRRDWVHKSVGYIWVFAMAVAIGSSFFIQGFAVLGPFSPIHLLSVFAARSLWAGLAHIRAGRFREHEQEMRSLYWTGLMVAGAFTFLPGRVLNRMLFSDHDSFGFVALGLVLFGVLLRFVWLRRSEWRRQKKSHILA